MVNLLNLAYGGEFHMTDDNTRQGIIVDQYRAGLIKGKFNTD